MTKEQAFDLCEKLSALTRHDVGETAGWLQAPAFNVQLLVNSQSLDRGNNWRWYQVTAEPTQYEMLRAGHLSWLTTLAQRFDSEMWVDSATRVRYG